MNKLAAVCVLALTLVSIVAIETRVNKNEEEQWLISMSEYIENMPECDRPKTDAECEAFEAEWMRFHRAIKNLETK